MKRKFTILLFGLLLAVGWTNDAFAQEATLKAADMANWTYSWTDASGTPHLNEHYVVYNDEKGIYEAPEVHNAYQIYGMLRSIYMDPAFPGPYKSAYSINGVREDDVYYGGCYNGWNIPGTQATAQPVGDVTITFASGNADFRSITVTGNNGSTSWSFSQYGTSLPQGWSTTKAFSEEDDNSNSCYMPSGGTITVPASLLNGSTVVTVSINAKTYNSQYSSCVVTVPGAQTEAITITNYTSWNDYTWTIDNTPTASSTTPVGALTVNITNYSSSRPLAIIAMQVFSGAEVLSSWYYEDDGRNVPWTTSVTPQFTNSIGIYAMYFASSSATITIPASMTAGHNSVQVRIWTMPMYQNAPGTISINGKSKSISEEDFYLWNFNAGIENFAADTYIPNDEGYTAIVVALNNTLKPAPEPTTFGWSTGYDEPDSVIKYIENNIQYVKLLTDGLRITDAGGNPGTVFNCDGTYNKFFFLGKGKARQKGAEALARINNGSWPYYTGECVIFWPLFEEFSPTTAKLGDEITDFYSKMMEGNVYDVVHDCAGVIQNYHEFSMSGESENKSYPFTGLNFFIPDYRLKYWVGRDSIGIGDPDDNGEYASYTYYDVDGRDMNALYDINNTRFRDPDLDYYYANFAQYNPEYAPKVGIYKITLEAVATQVGSAHTQGNQNFVVTLTWVSSLDQMAGHTVSQTYTVYYYDPNTGERKFVVAEGITDGQTGLTTVSYPAEQFATSYVIDHIVMGQPNDNDHPSFVAWSNHSAVVIPGWNDFIGLELDHHESDFIISENSRDNWYRNFLTVVNEDKYNGLTIGQIRDGMNTFSLYRQEYKKETDAWSGNVKIATITFDQIQDDQVHYRITYEPGQEILDYPESDKYTREAMDIPDQGWIRVKGNGDLVIWPNGYFVNFKSIVIKNGNNVLYNWSANDADYENDDPNLPTSPIAWETSPGSKMLPYITSNTGDKVCYMEGGGYIYIPGLLNTYNNLTVEIIAYTDGANVGRIEVNDKSQSLTNSAATYTWSANDENNPISPNAAPRRDNNESKPKAKAKSPKSNQQTENSPKDAFSKVSTNNYNKR